MESLANTSFVSPRHDSRGAGDPAQTPPQGQARPAGDLAALRARIRVLERGGRAGPLRVLFLGPAALDDWLPGGGLPLTGLHEISGERAEWDDGVASGFCAALLARLLAALGSCSKPVLWAAPRADLYGPGLAGFGLDPARLLLLRAGGDRDVLWALEEGLRAGALAAVVGEVAELERTAGRRLQLAAEAGGLPCFLLQRRRLAGSTNGPSAAVTRWRVAPLPSDPGPSQPSTAEADRNLPGRPRWRVALQRCRGAAPGVFVMEWDDASGGFAMAAGLCDGALGEGAPAVRAAPVDRLAG